MRGKAERYEDHSNRFGTGGLRPCAHAGGRGRRCADERGQGTTEYAILVGVLVVIAIVAIALFRPKIEELWTAIADGINSL